jgi:hypothetical protein
MEARRPSLWLRILEKARAILEMDEAVGHLMNGLHHLKLNDLAKVIIVSDHPL